MYKKFLPLIAIVVAMLACWQAGLFSYFSLEAISENKDWLNAAVANNLFLTLLAFISVYIIATALSIPGAGFLSILSGFLFGPWLGTFASVTGATIGACVLFFAVKTAFGDTLREKAGPWVRKFSDGFAKDAFSYMLTLRLVPLFPFFIVNLVPSLLGVKFRTFAIATFIGIIPGGFVYNLIGNGIGFALEQGKDPDLSFLSSPQFLAPLAGLGLLALVPVIYKRIKQSPAGAV